MLDISIIHSFSLLLKDLCLPFRERDYLIKRAKNEGLPFLTRTLPGFYKWVLESIENNEFKYGGDNVPSPFNLRSASLRRWRLELNRLNDGEDITSSFLWQLATLCNYYYKLSLPFTSEQLEESTSKYVQTQKSIQEESIAVCYDPFLERVRKTIETDYNLSTLDIDSFMARSRQGPGSVIGVPRSFSAQQYKDSLDGHVPEAYAPFSGAFRYRATSIYDGLKLRISIRKTADPDYCEVIFVPKDARGPRVISKETHYRAMSSLGFHDSIKRIIQHASKGRIQFTDQTLFQDLAREASLNGKYSTLDLSDASDRHSIAVARRLYRGIPAIRFALNLLRPTNYSVRSPSGVKTGRLACVAGMGNGLTFPLMALTIHAVIVTAARMHGHHVAAKHVYVYGDDIIVPSQITDLAITYLERMLFRVNTQKSFRFGKFRESCGGDFYLGRSITPIRLKLSFCDQLVTKHLKLRPNPRSRDVNNTDKIVYKLERHCRHLVDQGLTRLSEYYYSKIEAYLESKGFHLSQTTELEDPCLARYNPFGSCRVPSKEGQTVFAPVYSRGNLNRLIRRKLGPEREQDNASRWLSSGKGFVPFTGLSDYGENSIFGSDYQGLCSESFKVSSEGPFLDAQRYCGAFVNI